MDGLPAPDGWGALLDTMHQGILVLDAQGRIQDANLEACRILGSPRADLAGSGWFDSRWEVLGPDGTRLAPGSGPRRPDDPVVRWRFRPAPGDPEAPWRSLSAGPLPGGCLGLCFDPVPEPHWSEGVLQAHARIAEAGTLEEVLRTTLDEAENLTGSRIGFYHFLEADQATLTLQAWSTRTARDFCRASGQGDHYPVDQAGVWADAVRIRQPLIHNDYASLPGRKGIPEGHADVKRELVVPVLRRGRVVAILGVGNKPADYDDRDVDLVRRLADLAWDTAENQRTQESLRFREATKLERMTQLYAALSQVNQAIVLSPTPGAMLDKVCEVMVESGKFSMAWIGLDDPGTHDVRVASQYGDRHGTLIGLRVRSDDTALGQGGAGRAIREERTCVVNDLLGSTALSPWHELATRGGLAACAAIPFRKGGDVCGVLMVYADRRDYFGPQELALLEEAAGDVTFGLDHHELEARRRQFEAELVEAKAINEAIVDSTSDLIWSVDAERFDLLTFNRALHDFFRDERGIELRVGMPQEELFPPGAHRTRWRDRYLRALAEGRFTEEYTDTTGTNILKMNFNLLRRDGRAFGISVFGRDITESRKAQARIQRLTEELEQRVRERTAQLEAANRELEAFSYSVSHDLRSPLQVISGFSDILLEDCQDQLDAAGRKYLSRIRSSAARMGRLIEDLLSLSHINRREMRLADGDLSLLCEEILAGLAQAHPEREIELSIQPGLRVRASHGLLKVALENLLGNAWKFTSRQPHARIEFGEAQAPPGERAFFVRDNGAGFDMAHAGKLFKAFQRLHLATDYEGTGIGLATVQRIIQRHGGSIWAEAEPGKGATFTFSIPESLPCPTP